MRLRKYLLALAVIALVATPAWAALGRLNNWQTLRAYLAVEHRPDGTHSASGEVVNVKEFGATGNGRIVQDAAMTATSATLTSATAVFVAGDVGKHASVQGAGAAGTDLNSTISAFVSTTNVTLANAAGTTVSGKAAVYGTSDSTAINAAIAAAIVVGTKVVFPSGNYVLNIGINATNAFGLVLEGVAYAANTQAIVGTGVRLLPVSNDMVVLDLTASYAAFVRNLQIGSQPSAVRAGVGILLAQKSGSAASNLIRLENVFVTGRYSIAALYNYGVPSSYILGSDFYNYENGVYTAVWTRDNVNGVTSAYQTIAAGEQAFGDWTILGSTFHQNAATPGIPVRLRGVWRMRFLGGNFEIANPGGSEHITFETVAGTTNDNHSVLGVEFDGAPTNIFKATGELHGFVALGNSYAALAASAVFGGAAAVILSGAPAANWPFKTTVDVTIPAGATRYLGPAGHSATSDNAATLVSARVVVDRLDIALTTAPGGTETAVFTVQKNGAATAVTVTLTGAGGAGTDATHSVVFAPGDKISVQAVYSAVAAASQVLGGLRMNPF